VPPARCKSLGRGRRVWIAAELRTAAPEPVHAPGLPGLGRKAICFNLAAPWSKAAAALRLTCGSSLKCGNSSVYGCLVISAEQR